jgi:3-hydroxyacyl-[acyl-carrier-protein] dehydratase
MPRLVTVAAAFVPAKVSGHVGVPLATFEGSIRVGQEKAVIAEEISLIFAYADAVNAPVPINPATSPNGSVTGAAETPAAPVPPLRVAINA